MVILFLIISLTSLVIAGAITLWVINQDPGTEKMQEISELIHKGALTFLRKEYSVLTIFIVLLFLLLFFFFDSRTAIAFFLGAIFSALAANLGIRITTKANCRTASAAKHSLNKALRIAFLSGSVMGLSVVGLGLFGVILLYIIFQDPNIIYGFGMGASSVALFARVGGGIYTKAADVGADLVGKVEKSIPEDDPRNPAVIADNVGDNVGDVAGMGADLYESYVDSIIATMVLGAMMFGLSRTILPLGIASLGIIASIIGMYFVHTKEENPYNAINQGIFVTTILMIIFSYIFINKLTNNISLFYTVAAGIGAGILIGLSTEYFTGVTKRPTIGIAIAAKTGAGTDIIQGLAVGMLSTLIPVLTICVTILVAHYFSGIYGIALATVGMLSTLAITLATDAYGPVADNAGGIAEMTNQPRIVRKRTDALDALGNTTAAIGKGFAIGSAALTALALFVSYIKITNLRFIDLAEPIVIIGLFVGAMLPFIFSALTIKAVGIAAEKIIKEVRKQFRVKMVRLGRVKPDYNKCIGICTSAALKKMVTPTLLAMVSPLLIGTLFGPSAVAGLLAGSILTGFLLAVFMANTGAALDNAKKYIEAGHLGGKDSLAYKASVIGDTVGDPFKDTAGPSLNILIKLMSIIAIVFAPLFI